MIEIKIAELPSGERLRIELRDRRAPAARKLKGIKGGKRKRKRRSLWYAFRLTWRDKSGARSATFRKPIEAILYCERQGIEFASLAGSEALGSGSFYHEITAIKRSRKGEA